MQVHPTVTEFFHGQVADALRAQDVRATEPTEFYLVNLLAEFTATQVSDEPLALRLVQVHESSTPDQKAKGLKDIGDLSLVMSGLFTDRLARKPVDLNYYVAMGASAYGQLASLVVATRTSAATFFRTVYQELAGQFHRFVEVLQEVRRNTNISGSGNLLGLYEAYLRTGDQWIERRLREAGMVLFKGPRC